MLFVGKDRQKKKDRRQTQDTGIAETCREFLFITYVNSCIYLQNRVTERSAGKVLVGFKGLAQRLAHNRWFNKGLSYFSNANFWYSKLSITLTQMPFFGLLLHYIFAN